MSLKEIFKEDRRFHVLSFLKEDQDYSMSDMLLHKALGIVGHGVDPDLVKSDLAWLETQELVTLKKVSSLTIATLTKRGASIVNGEVTVPGVARAVPKN